MTPAMPWVFLGPSLPHRDARELLQARMMPPCRMGDVYAAVEAGATLIAIIDGVFEQTPAVWHKEILYALSQGIPVLGGGSMGALRAAELHPFGMIGVGEVFEQYRRGDIEDDDEVAVRHAAGDDGYRAQNEALVNMRDVLARAQQQGLIAAEVMVRLLRLAKAMYYPDRTWHALWQAAQADGLAGADLRRLIDFVTNDECLPLKSRDAVAVLQAAAALPRATPATDSAPTFAFQPTVFWQHLQRHYAKLPGGDEHGAGTVAAQRLRHHVRLFDQAGHRTLERAALLALAEQQRLRHRSRAHSAGTPDRQAVERFRRARQLTQPAQAQAWLRQQQLSPADCIQLAQLEGQLQDTAAAMATDDHIRQVLQLEGRYDRALSDVQAKWAALAAAGITRPTADDVDAVDDVLAWYQQHYRPIDTDLAHHAAQMGIDSVPQFLEELIAHYWWVQRQS